MTRIFAKVINVTSIFVLQILIVVCGLIGFMTGANDWLRGASVKGDFGELGDYKNSPTLNFTIRFLGGIWMGFGALLMLFATDPDRYKPALILALVFVILAGLGRVASMVKLGFNAGSRATAYAILAVELVLIPILLVWLVLLDW